MKEFKDYLIVMVILAIITVILGFIFPDIVTILVLFLVEAILVGLMGILYILLLIVDKMAEIDDHLDSYMSEEDKDIVDLNNVFKKNDIDIRL